MSGRGQWGVMQKLFVVLLFINGFYAFSSEAACIDVVDLSTELPAQITTARGTGVSFIYDFDTDHYSLSWQKDSFDSEWYGPFPLTMACGTSAVRWESSQFLLLESGCGTFCWYTNIFQLSDIASTQAPAYQRIERPLAFDEKRNLLVYYYSQNLIHIRNLNTGLEQEIQTAYECEFASGLCFGDVRFSEDELLYSWHRGQNGEPLSVKLASEMGNENRL